MKFQFFCLFLLQYISFIFTDDFFVKDDFQGSEYGNFSHPFTNLAFLEEIIDNSINSIIFMGNFTLKNKINIQINSSFRYNFIKLLLKHIRTIDNLKILFFLENPGEIYINLANLEFHYINFILNSEFNGLNVFKIENNSFLKFYDCEFEISFDNKILYFLMILHSSLSINNSNFKNILINNLIYYESNNNISNRFEICNSIFKNISQNIIKNDFSEASLLFITFNNEFIYFLNNSFSQIQTYNLITITSSKIIIFEKNVFNENIVINQILNCNYIYNLTMIKLKCTNNNKFNNNIKGGCFKISNSVVRNIFETEISNSYTNLMTLGFKFIDDSKIMLDYFGLLKDNPMIYIKDCKFINNSIFASNNYETGGCLYLDTTHKLIIENSNFYANTIDSTKNTLFKISSPCIFSINSYLSSNLAIYDKEIIDTFNSGRTGVFNIAQINSDVEGSLSFNGHSLLINNSYFFNNSGFLGGAIFINNLGDHSNQTILILNSNFKNNKANLGGSIFFSQKLFKFTGLILNCSFFSDEAKNGGSISTAYSDEFVFISINKCIFERDLAFFGGVIDAEHKNCCLEVINCVFIENSAMSPVLKLGGGTTIMINGGPTTCLISKNNLHANSGWATEGNNKNYGGGGIYAIKGTLFMKFTNFIFDSSIDKGGGFWVKECKLYLSYNIFQFCSARRGGVFGLLERTLTYINHSIFKNNYALTGAIFHLWENYENISLILFNCSFLNNKGEENLFNIMNSNVLIMNSIFQNNINNIFSIQNCNLTLVNVIIKNHFCQNLKSGCLIFGSNSNILIFLNLFENVQNFEEASNIYIDQSNIIISNSNFKNLTSFKDIGNLINSYNSSIIIEIITAKLLGLNFIYSILSSLIVIYSHFDNEEYILFDQFKNKLGGIYCQSCIELNFSFSSIKGNHFNYMGSCLMIVHYDSRNNFLFEKYFNILNSTFSNNIAIYAGGSIYIYNDNIVILYCNFIENVAQYGGAIYYETENSLSFLNLSNNVFKNNIAIKEGGAIKWIENEPLNILKNNKFFENSAIYGSDNAGFPIRLLLDNENLNITKICNRTFCRLLFDNIASGSLFPITLKFFLLDIYSNKILSINDK